MGAAGGICWDLLNKSVIVKEIPANTPGPHPSPYWQSPYLYLYVLKKENKEEEAKLRKLAEEKKLRYWILRSEAFKAELIAHGRPVPDEEAIDRIVKAKLSNSPSPRKYIIRFFAVFAVYSNFFWTNFLFI